MCAETCGKCSDNCADSDGKFQIEGEIRTCLWLKLRPNMQPVQCTPGTVSRRYTIIADRRALL